MSRAPIALLTALTLSACGAPPPPSTSPSATTGVVGGRVITETGSAPSHLIVSLVGAPISANVGGLGDFVLPNVPAGALALHFSGEGIAAGVDAGTIAGGETVTLAVRLGNGVARIDAIARVRGNEAIVEGPVDAPPAPLAEGIIIVGGRTVTLPPGAPAVQPGTRVRVTGTVSGAGIMAGRVEIL